MTRRPAPAFAPRPLGRPLVAAPPPAAAQEGGPMPPAGSAPLIEVVADGVHSSTRARRARPAPPGCSAARKRRCSTASGPAGRHLTAPGRIGAWPTARPTSAPLRQRAGAAPGRHPVAAAARDARRARRAGCARPPGYAASTPKAAPRRRAVASRRRGPHALLGALRLLRAVAPPPRPPSRPRRRRLLQIAATLLVLSALAWLVMGLMPGDPVDLALMADPALPPPTSSACGPPTASTGRCTSATSPGSAPCCAASSASRASTPCRRSLCCGRRCSPPWCCSGWALLLAAGLGVLLGVAAAARPRLAPLADAFAIVAQSIPNFWLGILLIILFAVTLGRLPAGGTADAPGRPRRCATSRCPWRRWSSPHRRLRAARHGGDAGGAGRALHPHRAHEGPAGARRGVAPRLPQRRHAGADVAALDAGALVSGALITETIFARPGMGKLIYDAVMGNDYNLALLALLLASRRHHAGDPRRGRGAAADRPETARADAALARDGRCSCRWRRARWPRRSRRWLGHDPFTPDLFIRHAPPSAGHPLGTDELGRDILLRLLFGARVSMAVGLAVAVAATALGTAVGLFARVARRLVGRGADADRRRDAGAAGAAAAGGAGGGGHRPPRPAARRGGVRHRAPRRDPRRCSAGSAWRGWRGRRRSRELARDYVAAARVVRRHRGADAAAATCCRTSPAR